MKWNNIYIVIFLQICFSSQTKIHSYHFLSSSSTNTKSKQLQQIYSLITNKAKLNINDKIPSLNKASSFSIYQTGESSYEISNEKAKNSVTLIDINYHKTLLTKGWDKLSIKSYNNSNSIYEFNPFIQSYFSGYAEGKMTYEAIGIFYHNLQGNLEKSKMNSMKQLKEFFDDIIENLNKKILDFSQLYKTKQEKEYYTKVYLFYFQIYGMYEGFNHQNEIEKKYPSLSMVDFLIMQADGEIPELLRWQNFKSKKYRVNLGDANFFHEAFSLSSEDPKQAWADIMRLSRCSALISITKDISNDGIDILAGHVTWGDYYETYRIYKHYDMAYGDYSFQASFSSYPGLISSTDDFIINIHKLVTTETTLNVLDQRLYSNVTSDIYIPNCIRINIAAFYSKNITEWIDALTTVNSGTYSSQWMVVDYKKVDEYNKGNTEKKDMFYLIEQIPNKIITKDMTEYLFENQYYGSVNRPYLKETNEIMQSEKVKNLYGDIFLYEGAERTKIFELLYTNKTNITLKEFKNMLRYNGFKLNVTDDPSNEEPSMGISSRYELVDHPKKKKYLTGGTDLKITNNELISQMTSIAINGPTNENNENLKTFKWSDYTDSKVEHLGLPEEYNFPYIKMSPNDIDNNEDIYTFN